MNIAFMITRHVHKNGEFKRLISRKKTAVLRATPRLLRFPLGGKKSNDFNEKNLKGEFIIIL